MLAAGFGWLEKLPVSVAKTIGLLEILGAAGLILAPVGYLSRTGWNNKTPPEGGVLFVETRGNHCPCYFLGCREPIWIFRL